MSPNSGPARSSSRIFGLQLVPESDEPWQCGQSSGGSSSGGSHRRLGRPHQVIGRRVLAEIAVGRGRSLRRSDGCARSAVASSESSMKSSAWRRSSSATIAART